MLPAMIAGFPWFTIPGWESWMWVLVVPMFFWAGCPCCGDCAICSDTWTGIADGTDVSTGTNCGWTETAGSWSVASEAVTTTDTSAVLLSNTSQPDGTGEQTLTVDLKSSASNDLLRVIVGWVDSSNYHFVEVKIATSGVIRLYKRSSGSNTLLTSAAYTFATDTFFSITACLNDAQETFSASIDGTVIAHVQTTVPASAEQFGIGTGATLTGTATFDNFVAASTKDECPDCGLSACGTCDEGTSHQEYQIDIDSMTDGGCTPCADLNGTYIVSLCFSGSVPSGPNEGDPTCVWMMPVDISLMCFIGGFDFLNVFLQVTDTSIGGDLAFHAGFTALSFCGAIGLTIGGPPEWLETSSSSNCDTISLPLFAGSGCASGNCTVTAL